MQDNSGPEYQLYGIHNVNLVKTVFGNWGVIGQPTIDGPSGAWIYESNEYIGDVSLLVGAEVTYDDDGVEKTFKSVVTCPVERPDECGDGNASACFEGEGTDFWGFQPVDGYAAPLPNEQIALSTNTSSWPNSWPNNNCGNGEWCGYFGNNTQLIQQESYYVMNDNNDEEFNGEGNNGHSFKPDPDNPSLNGLGLEVKVRGMQWQQFLAQDCLFFLYEIRNNSQTDYKKVVLGELVGTYVGNVPNEGNDDWSFFDVNEDIAYTGDFDNTIDDNPAWVGDVGMVAYAFLESPGNPYDGIDNDGDYIGSFPLFSEQDFEERTIELNDHIITIDDEYKRTKVQITDEITTLVSQGENITVSVGTSMVEGNEIDGDCGKIVNPNAYDGIDNDLDGLIDENYYLHYKQKRVHYESACPGCPCSAAHTLFEETNPRAYINYLSFENNNGYIDEVLSDLIDERRDDGIDNDGDWNSSLHDLDGDGVPSPQDSNFDATDPDESDQIGLTSFDYFEPSSTFDKTDDDTQWDQLAPGHFTVPSTVENGMPTEGEDGDFIFGTGYFPLNKGDVQRFSIALIYGKDLDDLYRNKEIVQDIYDKEYKFPPPPEKPTLTAVAGDSKVTLYWDRVAETTKDIVIDEYDFQGYKIYRASDPNFNDVRNITNAYGNIEDYSPLMQFDLADNIDSLFYPSYELFQQSAGLSFNLGDSTGLQHSFVDTDVINGRTYYYALTAYDSGNPEDDLFPAENTKYISVLSSGEIITDKNTAVVTPTSSALGLSIADVLIESTGNQYGGTGNISYEIIDEAKITGHNYLVEFWDTSMDEIDNDIDSEIDSDDLEELLYPITTYYDVFDEKIISTTFDLTIYDSPNINLSYDHIIVDTFKLYRYGLLVSDDDYSIISDEYGNNDGKISITNENILSGEFEAKFQHYPIFKSPYIQGAQWDQSLINDDNQDESDDYDGNILWIEEVQDSEVFDGLRLTFNNDWEIEYKNTYAWSINDDAMMDVDLSIADDQELGDYILKAYVSANDLRINFYDDCESCLDINDLQTNFKITDITRGVENLEYIYTGNTNGKIEDGDRIYIFENYDHDDFLSIDQESDGALDVQSNFHTWTITFTGDDIEYGDGDFLHISISKPFRDGDQFSISTQRPEIDSSLDNIDLSDIKVVPNPYIATTALESSLPPGVSSGRGERKIEFQNVPNDASIKIYNIRGQHIITLNHDGDIFDGSVSWDLRTKENMDIAFGVYLYVVESDMGIKKGKIAIIK